MQYMLIVKHLENQTNIKVKKRGGIVKVSITVP